jgi:HemY protein
MIRVVLFLFVVGLIALAEAWLADRPGDVLIVWLGHHSETSVMVLTNAILIVVALAILLWELVRVIRRSPDLIALFLRNRRSARGWLALSRGLIAVGAGDVLAARRFAQQAARLAPDDPLALLLAAQSAQLSGDRVAADQAFRAMVARDDTRLFGLRGLYVEAQRRDDRPAARAFAEEAARVAPSLAWAGQAALEFRCAAGDWNGALAALERNAQSGLVAKPAYRRQRAVLLMARVLAQDGDRETAAALAAEAAKLAPDLVPAAVLAARFLAEAGDVRKGNRIIEIAWRANPHPDLAEAYAHLRSGLSARDRLARVQALVRKADGEIEGALAIARAAIDAREFPTARAALAPFIAAPPRRVAMLMAELEEEEHGDVGRAREWMSRALNAARDPAWTADGLISDRWMPVSPVTGRLDAFEWRVPLAELAAAGSMIEDAEEASVLASDVTPLAPPPAEPVPPAPEAATAPAAAAPTGAAPAAAAPVAKAPAPRRPSSKRAVEPVIPLVHAPDDPGPEPELHPHLEPVPVDGGWRRLRWLFGL